MTSMLKLKQLSLLLGGLGLSTLPLIVAASDWIVIPGLTLEQSYSDNALLSNDDKVDESITVVRPSLSLYRQGGRASVDFNYAPEYRRYWRQTEDDELVHFLRAEGNVELLEDHLFLDGWATADMTDITSTARTGLGGLTGRAGATEIYTAGFSPYFKSRMGSISLFEARYTVDSISYSSDILDDSVGQRADLVLGSGSAFTSQAWEIAALYNQVDYEQLEENNEVSQFRLEFVQQLIRQLAVGFAAGYEEYNLALNQDTDDSLWSVGIIYTPNIRTKLAIGGGERVFGKDYYLDFSHRSQRTVWTANYKRDYISAREELSQPNLFQRTDVFGNMVRNPILENPLEVERGGTPRVGAEYYKLELFDTRFTLMTGRTTLTLGGGRTERIYENEIENTRDLNFVAWLVREISPRISTYLRVTGRDHEEIALNYTQWVSALGGSVQLGNHTSVGGRLAHLTRDAEIEVDSYEENSVNIYLTAEF